MNHYRRNMERTHIRPSATIKSLSQTGSLIKNIYLLLSITVLFSGLMAWFSFKIYMVYPYLYPGSIIHATLLTWVSLVFLNRNVSRNWSLFFLFICSGSIGYTLGIATAYSPGPGNGATILFEVMGGTSVIFCALSVYALAIRSEFNFLFGFMLASAVFIMLAMADLYFFNIPYFALITALIICGYILFDTSRLVNGKDTDCVRATAKLYLNLYMPFIFLLKAIAYLIFNAKYTDNDSDIDNTVDGVSVDTRINNIVYDEPVSYGIEDIVQDVYDAYDEPVSSEIENIVYDEPIDSSS